MSKTAAPAAPAATTTTTAAPATTTVVETPVPKPGVTPTKIDTVVVAPPAGTTEADPAKPEAEKPKVEPKKEEKLSKKAVKLAEREALIEKQEKEVQAKLDAWSTPDKLMADFKKNPAKVLEKVGMSFQEFATAFLADAEAAEKTPTQLEKIESELESVKKKLADKEEADLKAEDAAIQARIDKTFNHVKQQIKEIVETQPDEFEFIALNEAHNLVFETICEYYAAYEKELGPEKALLTPKQACEMVEKYLEEKARKIASAKKIAGNSPAKTETKTTTSFSKTLSDQSVTGAAAIKNGGVDTSNMSREQQIKHAARLIKYN